MNYYERHIGDYLKDTAHLSLLEHGVYTRLLDVYYTREDGIPVADAARLIGARTGPEKEALKAILAEFFFESPNGGPYRQNRCDAEIARFQDKQRKAKASADARWSQSERNANASNRGDADDMRTHSERNANGMPHAGASQSPDTRPIEEKEMEPRSTLVLVGTPPAPPPYRRPSCPTEAIVELFHEALPALPRVEVLTDNRKRHVSARWAAVCGESKYDRQQGLDWFAWFFGHVAKSRFLTGQVKGRSGDYFRCTFEFLMTPEKFARVIENFYHKDIA